MMLLDGSFLGREVLLHNIHLFNSLHLQHAHLLVLLLTPGRHRGLHSVLAVEAEKFARPFVLLRVFVHISCIVIQVRECLT